MSGSNQDIPKKRGRGRPKTTGRLEGVLVRLSPEVISEIEAHIEKRRDEKLTRPAVIRELVHMGLEQLRREETKKEPPK